MAELSPMMKQYLEIKKQAPDALLFFRLGDFYEMFFDDAKVASQELELVLTGRDCGLEERAPMCGVPFHSYESYVAKLVNKGYKVAICEQMEDPALTKGIVRREIIRVITPGTVIEGSMLDESRNNYICSVYVSHPNCGICFCDVSTGEVFATELGGDVRQSVIGELSRYFPKEVLLSPQAARLEGLDLFIKDRLTARAETLDESCFDDSDVDGKIARQFSNEMAEAFDCTAHKLAARAVSALLGYLVKTQKSGLERINELSFYVGGEFMHIDATARRNLELVETMRFKEKKGSLLWVIDKTKTAMGKRLIRKWVEQPLVNPTRIQRRLNAVAELAADGMLRESLTSAMVGINDMERLMTKIVYGSANAKELRALSFTASKLPRLKKLLENVSCAQLKQIYSDIDCLEDVHELIESAIVDEPPFSVREGGMIRDGYSDEVDQLREDMNGGRGVIAKIELAEREKTGIPKLKLGYNRVFGYYIEITNSYKDMVPEHYIRKQTLTNCERYITQELKEIESRVLGAKDRVVKLEYTLFEEVRANVANALLRVQATAHAIARLDVLCSFANVSVQNRYTRPLVNASGKIVLSDSRHPVVEALLDVPFVPNDVLLDSGDNRVAIITGPNMAGKSTYMRQTALIVLMAQIGCFVPASSAEIGVVDGIYTRVGASDDLASGQSTFMVEMNEVAEILENATSSSLIIFDEIGRGTSTYDGMSIARAVLEYVADKKKLGAKTLFATHYHELTVLETTLKCVKNYNIAAKKSGDDITFLRRIIRGGADESYGIEVAKLAGVPETVVRRAKQILKQLEEGKVTEKKKVESVEQTMFDFSSPGEEEALLLIRNADVNNMSPIEALGLLDRLCRLVK
ncbi:MAG: DNA mismatch repair protein MutS [Ruminococcaceae bacterium]|nr:DNA mismatch repair protein MutS [Oscillospiraceae bacterium]